MKTILTFIFIFGVIVVVHEFGHFLFAKLSGILVREFSIGMGPKLFAHKSKAGTTYTVRLLPIGGYVRMAGAGEDEYDLVPGQPVSIEIDENENITRINTSNKVQLTNSIPIEVVKFDLEDDLFISGYVNGNEEEEKTYSVDHDASIIEEDGVEVRIAPRDVQFQSAKLYQRILTNFAGPLFNFILTFTVFAIVLFMQGGDKVADESNLIGDVVKSGVAAKAGVQPNDRILSVAGVKVNKFEEIGNEITKNKNVPITIVVEREGKEKSLKVTPKAQKQEDGSSRVMIGINSGTKLIPLSLVGKFKVAVQKTWINATGIFRALKQLVAAPSLNQLGGPVMIFKLSSQVAGEDFATVLNFLAFLSVNLGIMNLLPIPALDGGKILFNIVEGIRRKPLSPEVEGKVTLVGFALLMLLMVLVTWNDIMRAFFR